MARQKRLKDLDDYLKPLRCRSNDGSEEAAAWLDRQADRQERAERRRKRREEPDGG